MYKPKPNKYFVYEGNILRAAQSTKRGAMQYLKPGYRLEVKLKRVGEM